MLEAGDLMSDGCDCMVCRMGRLIELAGEIEAEMPDPRADLYLMMQATTFLALAKGMPPEDFEMVLNHAWAQSEMMIIHRDKRKMN